MNRARPLLLAPAPGYGPGEQKQEDDAPEYVWKETFPQNMLCSVCLTVMGVRAALAASRTDLLSSS